MSAAVRAGRRAAAHRRSHCGCAALALAALAALALLAAPRPAAAADADALAAAVGQGRAFAAAIFNETDPAAQELRSRAAGPSQEGADTVDILQICPAVKLINALPKSDNRPSGNQLLCVMIDVGERLVLALPSISCPPNKTGETGYGRQTPPPTQGRDGSAAPRPLTALAPPPDDFSGPALADVLKAEGPTYAWLWGNIQNIYAYWACSKKNGGSLDGFLMPQGWTPVGGDASDPGVVYVGTRPYMVMIKNGTSLAFIMRGTQTTEDWRQNFKYQRAKRPLVEKGNRLKGGVILGFMEIVTGSLWAPVKAALDAEVVRGGATEIVFSGHSQGAALANILAYAAKNYLKSKGKAKQVVGAVGFATPSVGDSVFTKAFKAQVNARNLLFKNDLVPDSPCQSTRLAGPLSMPACAFGPVPTKTTGKTYWADFRRLPGRINIAPTDLPVQREQWRVTNLVTPSNAGVRFAQTHGCSYHCYVSTLVTDLPDNRCWLEGAPEPGYTSCTPPPPPPAP